MTDTQKGLLLVSLCYLVFAVVVSLLANRYDYRKGTMLTRIPDSEYGQNLLLGIAFAPIVAIMYLPEMFKSIFGRVTARINNFAKFLITYKNHPTKE